MKNKKIVKKLLASLCALAISAAPLCALAANPIPTEPAYLVIYGSQNEKFLCWIVSEEYPSYTITSPYNSEAAVIPGGDCNFSCNYFMDGQTSETDPAYFNFTLNCLDASGSILAKNDLRAQYAKFGDVNGDGKIDWADAHALQWFINSDYFKNDINNNFYYMESLRPMMDFDGNTTVDQKDVTALNKYLQGGNPGSLTPIGTMQWITLDTNTVSLLNMKNLNEKKLYIYQDEFDVTFQLTKK